MPIKIKKHIAFILLFFIIGGFVVGGLPQPAKAQWITTDIPQLFSNIWTGLKEAWKKIDAQIVATAFKSSLTAFLNKLAYDSAVYVAAGGSGQKSLINPFSKKAFENLGDAVAGGFIDELAQKTGFTDALGTKSLCEPIDLTTKVNLLMSFKKPAEPALPKRSLTAIKKNAQKVADDNLLELNAGIQIDEGAVSLSSKSLDNDLALAGTTAQMELSSYALELTRIIDDFQYIAELISTPVPDQTPHYQIDNNRDQLLVLEDDLIRDLNSFTDINNRANICYDKYLTRMAVGCALIPECADFGALACDKAATKANEYSAQLVGMTAKYLNSIQDLNKKIKEGFFSYTRYWDISDITNVFNPEANDVGQFMEIQKALSAKQQQELEAAKLKQLAEGPCKGLETPISGQVKTPSSAVCDTLNQALSKSTKGLETFTGQIVADAFGTFVNTLAAKLMERYFKKGLSVVIDRHDVKDKLEDILKSGASQGGKSSAEKAFGGLLTASIETGGQQDILSILTACPPEQPALNNCIIDEPFRRAIEKQYTVRQAMEAYKKTGGSEGLDPKNPFGHILVGTAMDEPDFKNGYPYRSMLYLRKYRIIPVGWELAAQYIKDTEATKQVHTLENVVDGFDNPVSPFFGLVDPAWVLKSPQVFCARQGPGPEFTSVELMCEKIASGGQCESDDYQARKVSRKTWCADEQTCLEEGENGDCKRYGYCTLEKPSWKLGGTQCEEQFASCEGYTNSITKANYTVLENTLNKKDCNASNVGCQWYCQDAPKMCVGGARGGQPCSTNNDCASIYCSVGTCSVSNSLTCSYDTDCPSGETCSAGLRRCVNGDTPGAACTTNAQCGRGVVDGVCEEGGVWSCKNTGTCSSPPFTACTKETEIAVCGVGNICNLSGDRVNLDRDVKKCEAKDAGCNQFIKVLPGTNLIGNSGFEDDADVDPPLTITTTNGGYVNKWYLHNNSGADLEATIDHTLVHSGKNSLYIEMNLGLGDYTQGLWMGDSSLAFSVVPSGFLFNKEKSYTASAWVYVASAATGGEVSMIVEPGSSLTVKTAQTSPEWERISITVPAGTAKDEFRIYPTAGSNPVSFYIDDLQIEEGDRQCKNLPDL